MPGTFSVSSSLPEAPSSSLPEAPEPQLKQLNAPPSSPKEAAHVAPLKAKYIPAGWTAQPLGVRGKILVGATDLYSFSNFGATILSAGYAHVTDGQPNYGVNSTAFGKRVGAAAVRETAEGVFTDIVFAPLLHEDPRYYQKGPEFNPVKRTIYAITRPLVTRTDGGRSTVNGSLLLGYAASAALTPAYYPQSNRNFHDVASTYGGSIGGAALGFFVEEFADDVLEAVHLKRKP